jgi:hypothetical protein
MRATATTLSVRAAAVRRKWEAICNHFRTEQFDCGYTAMPCQGRKRRL